VLCMSINIMLVMQYSILILVLWYTVSDITPQLSLAKVRIAD
jgi:hypothetical protein